jgi:DNA (cytosine-5)-methyltransferase 1
MRFGSVCSGIEAASVAWGPLGWEAAWLSEIEPFPSAVLAHHYPSVPNLGDMTTLPERILSGEVEAPDVFCGGTPCQAFSVAGLRNSLDDARGNLSLTFVGIANAIDHVRSVRSASPAIVFWENVPGVLSTKDNAFGCFLGALAGEDDPIIPSGEKWTNAGCVYGPQRTVAWRVLDAQYFGVAQRRRRVFVVASARDDFDPTAVLFEFDGVRRDTAPSREAGKEVAGTIAARFGVSRNNHEECVSTYSTPAIGNIVTDDVSSCIARNTGSGGETQNPAFVLQPVTACRMVAFGEYSVDGTASAMKARDYKDATDLVAQPIDFRNLRFHEGDVAGTMQAKSSGGYSLNYETGVMQPIALQDITPREKAQNGRGWNDDGTAYTVDTHATQGVLQPIPIDMRNAGRDPEKHDEMNRQGVGVGEPNDPAHTVTSAFVHAVAQPIAWDEELNPSFDVAGTLLRGGASGRHDGVMQPIGCFKGGQGSAAGGIGYDEHIAPTLNAADSGSNRTPALMQGMAVRRLTPVECERLQGFPDNYSQIPWRNKPAEDCPDGPRYKALGNSWAVPNVRWIGKRIQEALNAIH